MPPIEEDPPFSFDINSIERAIQSGFIEVPVIEDFDEFRAWFNNLKDNDEN